MLTGTIAAAGLGPQLGPDLREWLLGMPASELAERLIGGIAYGVSLMNLGSLSIPLEYILPGAVLLLAVLVDVLSRRGARTGSVIRV